MNPRTRRLRRLRRHRARLHAKLVVLCADPTTLGTGVVGRVLDAMGTPKLTPERRAYWRRVCIEEWGLP